jgi:hypothetical protein
MHTNELVGRDPKTRAQVLFWPVSSSDERFGLLAPTISVLQPIEAERKLVLNGVFGSDTGQVLVNCTQLKCSSWTPYNITCELPERGTGSAGNVTVTVRDHRSNVVQLSAWEGDFDFKAKSSQGTLEQNIKIHARFRADIHKSRLVIHQPPQELLGRNGLVQNSSSATFNCTGSYAVSDTESFSWSGGGALKPDLRNELSDNWFRILVAFWDASTLNLTFTATSSGTSAEGCVKTTMLPGRTFSGPQALHGIFFGDPILLQVRADGTIIGDTKRVKDGPRWTETMRWSDLPVSYPPDPEAPR